MKILASNDDGITCEGLLSLVKALRAAGHCVTAIAPDRNRTGASHSLTFDRTLPLKEVGAGLYSYGGTPVDCILAGMLPGGIDCKPDIIVSGINEGANLGTDLLYSGTAGAARQGSLYGIPSIAFSAVDGRAPYPYSECAKWAVDNLDVLCELWKKGTFVNVNFPNESGFQNYALTFPSYRFYEDRIIMKEKKSGEWDCAVCWENVTVVETEKKIGFTSDWEAVREGKVAVSVVYNHPLSTGDSART